MNLRYFKKFWDESTGEELTNSWGNSTYYFETDENLNVIKQIQKFENGKSLKYDEQNYEDEFVNNELLKTEFYEIWNK